MSGALQVVGLALLGLGGAFLLGAKDNPFSLLFTIGGFIALLLLAQAVATRPELIDGIGVRVLGWVNSARGKPADTGLHKWRETLHQLESVSLSRRALGTAFGWSLFDGGYTFASKIASAAAEFNDQYKAGAYIAAGLVLFVLTFLVNSAARAAVARRTTS